MKDLFKKYFGLVGLVFYYILALVVRIPVAFFLLLAIVFLIILWNPIMGRDDSPTWLNHLYDWYCGK